MNNTDTTYPMTKHELDRKKLELEKYKSELQSIQKRYSASKSLGTDYETGTNPEMLQAASDQEPVNQRILELQNEIDHAEIVTIDENSNKVGYGAVVIINFIYAADDIEESKLLISSTRISDTEYSVCSPNGPLYSFIKGKEKGYKGRFVVDNQKIHVAYDFEILDVYYPDPANQK